MYCTLFKNCLVPHKAVQLTFEDFMKGLGILDADQYKDTYQTKRVTFEVDETNENTKESFKKYIDLYQKEYKEIPTVPEALLKSDIKEHYSSFKIPKKSGGLRKIDAPDAILKEYLAQWKRYIESNLRVLTHEAAHAYVPTRSCYTALQVHQKNESKWFLKLDIHDFFGSHTPEYVMKELSKIYPFAMLFQEEGYKKDFEDKIRFAFLDNKLPQGTPLSPTLTNILMMGIDNDIQAYCNHFNLIYTRYADDILISSKDKFNWKQVQNMIIKILNKHEAPFQLNTEKTRYGSSAGRNWNLGLMLNKDNNITIGHRENQRLRAAIDSFCKDYIYSVQWNAEDKQHLAGLISYAKSIQKEYTMSVIKRYNAKYSMDILEALKVK